MLGRLGWEVCTICRRERNQGCVFLLSAEKCGGRQSRMRPNLEASAQVVFPTPVLFCHSERGPPRPAESKNPENASGFE